MDIISNWLTTLFTYPLDWTKILKHFPLYYKKFFLLKVNKLKKFTLPVKLHRI